MGESVMKTPDMKKNSKSHANLKSVK